MIPSDPRDRETRESVEKERRSKTKEKKIPFSGDPRFIENEDFFPRKGGWGDGVIYRSFNGRV